MSAVETANKDSSSVALPGLGRALILAGKLGQKSAEDIYRKATSGRTSFIAELTGSGAVSASDLAHTMSSAFAAPLVDLDALDAQRLPKGLLDGKICQAYRVVVDKGRGKGRRHGVRQVRRGHGTRPGQFSDKTGATGGRFAVNVFGRFLAQFAGQNQGAAQPG